MAEIIVSAILQSLMEKLTSLGLDYVRRKVAPPFSRTNTDVLTEWKKKVEEIYAVLDDAEDKQLSGGREVKQWLDNVKNLAFDMEDLLDELEIEAAQAKSEAESSKSRGWMKSCPFSRHKTYRKIQKINDRLGEIVAKKAGLSLNPSGRTDYSNQRSQSTCLLETPLLGRKKEQADILKLLTDEAKNSDATPSIVAIVGMGGVGKTALAQQLYNDASVSSYFEKKAWVCVSDTFIVFDLTLAILWSITGSSHEGKDLNGLQLQLRDSLLEKKFLVVLDDMWNEDYEEWTNFLKPFQVGAKGSKIIITARNSDVVSKIGASQYPLNGLSDDDCTSLLASHALGKTNFQGKPHLAKVGEEIAKKCEGLPLAAKLLGGALRDEENPDKWEETLHNKLWDLRTGEKVLSVLKLSYVHLPPYLKRCFAYCAIFPKNYKIEKDELVMLWTAEGFLGGQKEKESNLKLGRNYFDELAKRSFLEQTSANASKFSMHDLLNDLAKSIQGGTCFSSGESQLVVTEDHTSLEKTRYASFIWSRFVTSTCLRAYHRMKALRSLMLLSIGTRGDSLSISNKVLNDLLTELKRLRVLSLCHCDITEVPKCIGDLKYLRYLNLSYTDIERLPESIVGLCKLQALILRGCRHLLTLPQGITKLVSLQFLDIRKTRSLKEMPSSISNLENLIVLSKFVVGLDKGPRLEELKNLQHLQGTLRISGLQMVEEVRDDVLVEKKGLSKLILHWDEDRGNLPNERHKTHVLNFLRPHTNLESLTISYYDGAIFPSWLDGGSYSKIVSLCLKGCRSVMSLPSLGQLPSLRELSLEGLNAISMIGSEFYGDKMPFPSLKTLKFEEMLAWKNWSPYAGGLEEGAPFSHLQNLIVRNCPLLVETLPCQLRHLVKLEIQSCRHLNISTDMVCLPSLRELLLEDCNKEILKSLVNLTSLTFLQIWNLAELVCFNHGFMRCMVKLKELCIGGCNELKYLWQDGNEMLDLNCLQQLSIQSCHQFTSFVAEGGAIELPCNLERMELSNCTSLEKFPSKLHTLKSLRIWQCPKLKGVVILRDDHSSNNAMSQLECQLTSFPHAKSRSTALKTLEIWECKGIESLEEIIVESLECLTINRCENLKSLPQCLHTLCHLTTLKIRDCPALMIEDFPPLPITLSCLWLEKCPKIKSIASCNNLIELDIYDCPALKMEDFPPLPITLSRLSLMNCPKIKSIASCNIAKCNNFTELILGECPALEIEDFPPLPITLSRLRLWGCPKIKSLPKQWHHLPSLRCIVISNCPNIEFFPKGGWPPNLQYLLIGRCEKLKQPVREWGLPFLTSLQYLSIDGRSMGGEGEKVCFPSDADAWSLLFPSSLTSLSLFNMRKVERLSSGLRNHLSSLQFFEIVGCPKLRDLPENGLPPSLQQLKIRGCKKIPRNRYSKLADKIPFLEVDKVWIR